MMISSISKEITVYQNYPKIHLEFYDNLFQKMRFFWEILNTVLLIYFEKIKAWLFFLVSDWIISAFALWLSLGATKNNF